MDSVLGLPKRLSWPSLRSFFAASWERLFNVFSYLRNLLWRRHPEESDGAHKEIESSQHPGTLYVPIPLGIDREEFIRKNQATMTSYEHVIVYEQKGTYVAFGSRACLDRAPSGELIKYLLPPTTGIMAERYQGLLELEAEIYMKLGNHPRIPSFLGWDPEGYQLSIEFMENGDLRSFYRDRSDSLTPELRSRWSKQAAEAVSLLHSFEIIHCDIVPRNFLLDNDLNLKIADFGGSSNAGSFPEALASTRFCSPRCKFDIAPVFNDDVFSLGSLFYFLMAGEHPLREISSDDVEKKFEEGDFPETSHLRYGDIMQQCWRDRNLTAENVQELLEDHD